MVSLKNQSIFVLFTPRNLSTSEALVLLFFHIWVRFLATDNCSYFGKYRAEYQGKRFMKKVGWGKLIVKYGAESSNSNFNPPSSAFVLCGRAALATIFV